MADGTMIDGRSGNWTPRPSVLVPSAMPFSMIAAFGRHLSENLATCDSRGILVQPRSPALRTVASPRLARHPRSCSVDLHPPECASARDRDDFRTTDPGDRPRMIPPLLQGWHDAYPLPATTLG